MSDEIAASQVVFERLSQRYEARGGLTLSERGDALRALREGLRARQDRFVKAISADFGYRSRQETLLTELVVVLQAIDYTLPRIARWARPRRLPLAPPVWPARAYGEPMPRGIACVMGPSNYPLQLAAMPLIAALSAGCPTLIKPSEMTPRTADEIAALVAAHLDPDKVGVVCGGPELGAHPVHGAIRPGDTEADRRLQRAQDGARPDLLGADLADRPRRSVAALAPGFQHLLQAAGRSARPA